MPQTADDMDAVAVRTWCSLALEALGREREAIDAINVYPVADGDTGTNLYLTVESATQAVEAVFAAHETGATAPVAADAVRAMAHGALIGARGTPARSWPSCCAGWPECWPSAMTRTICAGRSPSPPQRPGRPSPTPSRAPC